MNNVKIIKMPKKFEASYVLEDSLDRILYTINFKQFELKKLPDYLIAIFEE